MSWIPTECGAEDFLCADLDSDCDVELNDYATFASCFGLPPAMCGQCGGMAAAGGSGSPDISALAAWTLQHIPAPDRASLAERCRSLADCQLSASADEALCEFADLIDP